MLVAMAVLGLTTYALLLSQPHLLTSLAQSDPGPAFQETPHTCSHTDKESVWSQLPHCEPRNTLVEVPLPADHPNVLNVSKATIQMYSCTYHYIKTIKTFLPSKVVPKHVELARCAGTCHTSAGQYKRCMAASVAVTSVRVMYETAVTSARGDTRVEEVCSALNMEVHTACSCGCQELACSQQQVRRPSIHHCLDSFVEILIVTTSSDIRQQDV